MPMPSLGIELSVSADELAAAASEALDTQLAWGIDGWLGEHRTEFSITSLGSLLITSGRTSPVALSYAQGERITVELCYAGCSRFRQASTDLHTAAGDILVFPNHGGILCGGLHSGISFSLERRQLERTALAMWGCDIGAALATPHVFSGGGGRARPLFALFHYVDQLLLEDPHLADGLGLDDQVCRLVAFELARAAFPARVSARWQGRRRWSGALDELVDYITSNRSGPITLTDLEERSQYSARHLQNLFRRKFGCTPMQFVRRQRLQAAMEQLRAAAETASVTRIARDCGYRSTSNFSSDFQRAFGERPSQVLRRSRQARRLAR